MAGVGVAGACRRQLGTLAHAQESRLDAVQKGGALRVCTPGDYKPFSLAKATGEYDRTLAAWTK
jgi:cyclohexadienyl dehydratase